MKPCFVVCSTYARRTVYLGDITSHASCYNRLESFKFVIIHHITYKNQMICRDMETE